MALALEVLTIHHICSPIIYSTEIFVPMRFFLLIILGGCWLIFANIHLSLLRLSALVNTTIPRNINKYHTFLPYFRGLCWRKSEPRSSRKGTKNDIIKNNEILTHDGSGGSRTEVRPNI